jgi:hypothetical protein
MTSPAASMQVERVLDDLIQRLAGRESTKEIRAALIEARRLKNVTMRWAAIPPPPDARREMLTRVMELVASVGADAPLPHSEPPKASGTSAVPSPRPVSSPVPNALRGGAVSPIPSSAPPISRRSPASFALTEPAMEAVPSPVPPPADVRTAPTAKSAAYRSDPPEGRQSAPAPRSRGTIAFEDGFENPTRGETLMGFGAKRAQAVPPPPPPGAAQPKRPSQSNLPTAPPPPPSAALGESARSSPKNPKPQGGARSTTPSGGFGDVRGRTLAQGSEGVNDALEALADAKVPRVPRIEDHPTTEEPAVARSVEPRNTLKPANSAPSQGVLSAAPVSPSPVRAVGPHSEGALEGFSSSVSNASVPVPRASSPGPGSPSGAPKIPTLGPGPGGASSKSARPATQALFSVDIAQAVREARASNAPPAGAKSPSGRPKPPSASPSGLRTLVAPGVTIVRPGALDWLPHPSATGVTMKVLFRDPRSGVFTALVRLAPGAVLPRRRHAAPEEMFLVEGAAKVGDHAMNAGEYSRAESETTHAVIRSEAGCTFFLCGSEHDEILEDT